MTSDSAVNNIIAHIIQTKDMYDSKETRDELFKRYEPSLSTEQRQRIKRLLDALDADAQEPLRLLKKTVFNPGDY